MTGWIKQRKSLLGLKKPDDVNNAAEIGRVGELFAQSLLERYGIRTAHVDIKGDDLWCKTPRDVFFKVQVKSCGKPILYAGHHTMPKYNFVTRKIREYTGVLILVALDKNLLLAKKGTEVNCNVLKVRPELFSESSQDKSIVKHFGLKV